MNRRSSSDEVADRKAAQLRQDNNLRAQRCGIEAWEEIGREARVQRDRGRISECRVNPYSVE